MNRDKTLKVFYHERPVGILAETRNKQIAFEYDDSWAEVSMKYMKHASS